MKDIMGPKNLNNDLYRKKECTYGEKTVSLLKEKDIDYKDHIISTKEEEEKFKNEHSVETTPQVFIDGKRIGGFTDLAEYFNEDVKEEKSSYTPVIALFAVAGSIALATKSGMMGFMGYSLCLLSLLKIMDLSSFVKSFKKYDLITKKISKCFFMSPSFWSRIGCFGDFCNSILFLFGHLLKVSKPEIL